MGKRGGVDRMQGGAMVISRARLTVNLRDSGADSVKAHDLSSSVPSLYPFPSRVLDRPVSYVVSLLSMLYTCPK